MNVEQDPSDEEEDGDEEEEEEREGAKAHWRE